MATENKRQSVGGKGPANAAGSNFAPAGTVALDMALSGAIGARIRVTTIAPVSVTHEGTLFTACPITNLIAINTSPAPPTPMTSGTPALAHPGDYHIIPVSSIQSFELLSLPPKSASSNAAEQVPSFSNAYPSIYPLDIRALKNREAAAIAKLHEREQRRGKGVSKEAQDLFDAFSRTMPARWQGTSIVVADTVVINKPYHVDNCRSLSPDDGGAALMRVRKVLEMERKKIELRSASLAITNSGNFPRSNANNATSNNTSASTSSDRERDAKAAAVALPVSSSVARGSPPVAAAANQRKGG